MLHHARDVVPGVQELVEAHRAGTPAVDEVRSLAFEVSERRYHLLLGLRRGRFWTAVRPRAFEAAFDSLRRAYRVVVCDTDADVEGEDAGGSVDVEERHQFARTAVTQADAVFVVGMPTMKGVHSLVRVVHDILGVGVDAARIAPVVNQAPRSPRARASFAATLHALVAPAVGPLGLAAPVFLPTRRVDDALRDGVRLPPGLGQPLVGALHAIVERAPARVRRRRTPTGAARLARSLGRAGGGRMTLSPLQEVERRVQFRAKEIALDMADEKGLAELRAIVDDEVALWSSDFKRGLRAFDLVDREVVAERAYRNLAGYGPLEPLLADDDVWEVMLNAPHLVLPGQVFRLPPPPLR